MNAKNLALVFALLLTATVARAAAPNDLTAALQRGLFEEEANRNLDAAMAAYQSLVGQFDKDRQIAATAVFRLGECYRKLGKTNEAVLQYERIVKEFADQSTLATLSRQNLTGLGANRPTRSPTIEPAANTLSPAARAEQRRLLEEEIKLVEQKLGDQQILVQSGVISPGELIPTQRDLLDLKRKLVALTDAGQMTAQPGARTGSADDGLGDLRRQLAAAEQDLNSMLNQWKEFAELDRDKARIAIQQSFPNPVLDSLMKQLAEAEQHRTTLRKDFGDAHTEVVKATALMETILKQIDAQTEGVIRSLDMKRRTAERNVDLLQNRLKEAAVAAEKAPVTSDAQPSAATTLTTNDEDQEIRRIQAMIQNSPDLINAPAGEGGQTPLITAASKGQLTVARYLLDHGANVNARAGDSSTALQLATFGGHKAMVELLLSRGADVNARRPANSTGTTALHIASDRGFKSVVEVLLANKAEVNFLAKQSTGSRYYAGAGTPLILAARGGHLDTVKLLLQSKANPNLAEADGTTALHEAARQGHRAAAEALLGAGADVNAANPRQGTPLLLAAEGGHLEMVDALLARGAKVDARRDSNSYWPLLTAVGNGHVAVVKSLLEHKADPNLVGPDSPVGIAVQKGSTEILELLLQHDANPNLAPMLGNRAVPFPLLNAAANDKADAVALLLKFKADPNQRTASGGETVLQYAISRPQIVKRLLEAGANPNARDGEGRTPLLRAVDQGDLESADLLLQHGADPNESVRQGFTPLHTAVANNNQPLVELLLKNKADPNRLDETGRTPLDLAKQSRNSSIPRGISGPPLPMPGRLPGAVPGVPGAMFSPGIASGSVTQSSTNDMITLLRQGGALDDLPRMDRIEISRSSTGYREVVFTRGTNDWNQYRLLEVLAWRFGLIRVAPQGIWEKQRTFGKAFWDRNPCRYPDLRRVLIHRPQPDGKGRTTIPVDVAKLLSSGDCSLDQPLKWGDIIEFPEADHPVNESWSGPAREELEALLKCVSRQISLSVKGSNSVLTLRPIYVLPGGGMPSENGRLDPTLEVTPASYVLRSVMENSQLIRASSDLAHVKVKRPNYGTGSHEWVLDCSGNNAPEFWLRNGDVIEVPEKP